MRMGSQIGDDVEVEMGELCSIPSTGSVALSKSVLNFSRVKAVAKRCSRSKCPKTLNPIRMLFIRYSYEYEDTVLLGNETWKMRKNDFLLSYVVECTYMNVLSNLSVKSVPRSCKCL